MKEITPGHGQPGVQQARLKFVADLMSDLRDYLRMNSCPFQSLQVMPNRLGMPELVLRFDGHTLFQLDCWSGGPGNFEPRWYYQHAQGGPLDIDDYIPPCDFRANLKDIRALCAQHIAKLDFVSY